MKLSLLLSAILLTTPVTTPPTDKDKTESKPETETELVEQSDNIDNRGKNLTFNYSVEKKPSQNTKPRLIINYLNLLSETLDGSSEYSLAEKLKGMSRENEIATVDDYSQYYLDMELLSAISDMHSVLLRLETIDTDERLYLEDDKEKESFTKMVNGYSSDIEKVREQLKEADEYLTYLQTLDRETMEKRYAFRDANDKIYVIDYTMFGLTQQMYVETQGLIKTHKEMIDETEDLLDLAEDISLNEQDWKIYGLILALLISLLILVIVGIYYTLEGKRWYN